MDNTHLYVAGDLDPSFSQSANTPGWVDILHALGWPPTLDLFFSSVTPAPQGKLYVSGYFAQSTNSPVEYFIARLLEDGQRDGSFGNDGHIRGTFPINFKLIIPTSITLQADAKILMQALGYSSSELPDPILFVARFSDTGNADPTFADGGLMRHELPAGYYNFLVPFNGYLQSLPDGRILACTTGIRYTAQGTEERAVLYRLNAEGALDNTFNGTGVVDFGIPGTRLQACGLVVQHESAQNDHKVVIAGHLTYRDKTHTRGFVARLDATGQLDKSFGPSGSGFFEFGLDDQHIQISAIAARNDGVLALAGTSRSNPASVTDKAAAFVGQGLVMVLNADGVPDADFNHGQLLLTPINERYSVQWLAAQFQEDGKLLLAGRSNPLVSAWDTYVYLGRYLKDSTPDLQFGRDNNGRVETMTGGNNDVPMKVQLQPDKKILLGLNAGGFRKGTLFRYLND